MGAYLCKDSEHAKQAKEENAENAMLPASEKAKKQDKEDVAEGENPDIPFADATGDEENESSKSENPGKVVNDYSKSSADNSEPIRDSIEECHHNVESQPFVPETSAILENVHNPIYDITITGNPTNDEQLSPSYDLEVETGKTHTEDISHISNDNKDEPISDHSELLIKPDEPVDDSSIENAWLKQVAALNIEKCHYVQDQSELDKNNDSNVEESIHDIHVKDNSDILVEEPESTQQKQLVDNSNKEETLIHDKDEFLDSIQNECSLENKLIEEDDTVIKSEHVIEENQECVIQESNEKIINNDIEEHSCLQEIHDKHDALVVESDTNVLHYYDDKDNFNEQSKLEELLETTKENDQIIKIETNIDLFSQENISHQEKETDNLNEEQISEDIVGEILDQILVEHKDIESEDMESSPINADDIEANVEKYNENEFESILNENIHSLSEVEIDQKSVTEDEKGNVVYDQSENNSNQLEYVTEEKKAAHEEQTECTKEEKIRVDENETELIIEQQKEHANNEHNTTEEKEIVNEEQPGHFLEEVREHVFEVEKERINEEEIENVTEEEIEHLTEEVKEHANEDAKEHVQEEIEHLTEEVKEHAHEEEAEHLTEEVKEHVHEEEAEHLLGEVKEHAHEEAEHLTEEVKEHVHEEIQHSTEEEENVLIKSENPDEQPEKVEEKADLSEENKNSITENLIEICPKSEEHILKNLSENSISDIDLNAQHISTNGNSKFDVNESDDQSFSNEIEIENEDDVKEEELSKMVSDAVGEIVGDAKYQVQHIIENATSTDHSIEIMES